MTPVAMHVATAFSYFAIPVEILWFLATMSKRRHLLPPGAEALTCGFAAFIGACGVHHLALAHELRAGWPYPGAMSLPDSIMTILSVGTAAVAPLIMRRAIDFYERAMDIQAGLLRLHDAREDMRDALSVLVSRTGRATER